MTPKSLIYTKIKFPFQLPAQSPESKDPTYKPSSLSVLEVSDPKICILAHLMSPLEPIDPILESPLSHPLIKQRAVASELLNEVSFHDMLTVFIYILSFRATCNSF